MADILKQSVSYQWFQVEHLVFFLYFVKFKIISNYIQWTSL